MIIHLKDPSHPLCFARFEGDMRHFRCHRNSSFLQCEFKSFYILPNTAHSGLNSPSICCQTISGFIHWIICELFVIFRIKSVTPCKHGNVIAHRSGSSHNSNNIEGRRSNHHCKTFLIIFRVKEKIVHSLKGLSNLFADILP